MMTIDLLFPDTKLMLTPQLSWLSPMVQVPLLVLLCVVPLVLLLWLYRYELKLVSPGTATGLLVLRMVVLVLILMLVCLKPIYARNWTEDLPGRVLVVVDRSDSMEITDPQREAGDKLRLALALGLHRGLVSKERMETWIEDHTQKRTPRWVDEDEARDDPERRRELEEQRRQVHDDLLSQVDKLTRTETQRMLLSGSKVQLLPRLQARHKVELMGFHRETWDVELDQLDDLFTPIESQKDEKEAKDNTNEKEKDKDKAQEDPAEKKPSSRQDARSAFTDLRLPLDRSRERAGPGHGKILGVVLLTDGQHNFGDPPNKKAAELAEAGVPIYPIALGARKPPPDVAIVDVKSPHTVFKDVDAGVEVRFKITGLEKGDYIVALHRLEAGEGEKKKLLQERTIHHAGKDREYSETFSIRMDKEGTQTVVASIRPKELDGKAPAKAPAGKEKLKDTRAENNRRLTTINVADDTAKVLLVDGEARWEFHYLATALERDRSMKLTRVVFEQPRLDTRLSAEQLQKMGSPREKLPSGPDALAKYDCIILGDVTEKQLPLPDRKRLEKYVADRGGTLVVVAGKRSMPMGFPRTLPSGELDPLHRLLPIERPRVIAPLEGFHLTLTRAGTSTKFMRMDAELDESSTRWSRMLPQARWSRMRPHYWGVVGQAKPGAVPLAHLPERGESREGRAWNVGQARKRTFQARPSRRPPVSPPPGPGAREEKQSLTDRERENALFVRQNYGFGQVLYIGLDTTWRWRYKVGDRYHHRFWSQAIKWAASDKPLVTGNEFVRFGTPQPVYRQGEDVQVVVRLEESAGQLDSKLLAGARIFKMGEKEGEEEELALIPLTRRATQPRVLDGKINVLMEGRYAVELYIPQLKDKLLSPGGPAGSPEAKRAGKPLRASFRMMPPMSRETIDLETKWPLLEELATRSAGKVYTPEDVHELVEQLEQESVSHPRHSEQRLWQSWWTLLLVVLLLTVEWAARKWSGLP